MGRTLSSLLLLGGCWGVASGVFASPETLRFKVYLDQDPIGDHSFELSPSGAARQVLSQARFDVGFLFFTAYRYRHESREVWRDGCLEEIRATTDDNGTGFAVAGSREGSAMNLEVNGQARRLPACVSTFAYWDLASLQRPQLLNAQTGELVPVRFESQGAARRTFRGQEIEAEVYRLRAEELDLTLWYTPEGDWIGLESDTGNGRTLRYERL